MGGPLKSSGDETLVASVEKNNSAPGVPDGTALPGPGSPGGGAAALPEKKGQGRRKRRGRQRGSEDIVGVGDIKSYAGGDPLITSSGEGAGFKSAAGFSSVTGMGPAFSPAGIKTAEGAGTSGVGVGRSEGAGGTPTAKLEKAAGAGQGRMGRAGRSGLRRRKSWKCRRRR